MELAEFKSVYPSVAHLRHSDIVEMAGLNHEFAGALLNDKACRDWYTKQKYEELNFDYRRFCCLEMALWNIEHIKDERSGAQGVNPHRLIVFWYDLKAFGVLHAGSTAYTPIAYCPWCGAQLPEYIYTLPSSRPSKHDNSSDPFYRYKTRKAIPQDAKW